MIRSKEDQALEMLRAVDAALDDYFMFDAPVREVRGMKAIVEAVRERVEEADIPEHSRMGALEELDRMSRALDGAIHIHEE